jgi:hypothetical protein
MLCIGQAAQRERHNQGTGHVCPCHEGLFGVVADENSKDLVASVPNAIMTHHFDSCFAEETDWP